MSKFYITNAIPYVNAPPHIGHALEFIQSDTIARYHRLLGEDVALSCGADENSLKNVQAAEAEGIEVQKLVDKNTKLFFDLWEKLGTRFDRISRGSDPQHIISSQKLWNLCTKDIYKKTYEGLYCIGCEQFYEKEELNAQGECFEHPGKKLDEVKEENYFFKLSKYTDEILDLIESDELEIVPEFRKNEVLGFLKQGLKDISISRSNKRAKNWGVPVPEDNTQRMYVWFDALNIYQTAVGFADEKREEEYKKWWPADLHVIGKGILRFHAVYWPAFLLSAGLKLPKKLFVHDYITVNGQKMSKTLGNVVDPVKLIDEQGTDALRYYLLAKISPFNDGDFSEDKFREVYNADLANGLGNLVARVAKLAEKNEIEINEEPTDLEPHVKTLLEEFNFNEALGFIWGLISIVDHEINKTKPWELKGDEAKKVMSELAHSVITIAYNLKPFLPETSEKILKQLSGKVKSGEPLFPRLT